MILLYKAYTSTAPSIFLNKLFSKVNQNHLRSCIRISIYRTPKSTMNLSRGPILRNTVLNTTLKEIESLPPVKAKVKKILR